MISNNSLTCHGTVPDSARSNSVFWYLLFRCYGLRKDSTKITWKRRGAWWSSVSGETHPTFHFAAKMRTVNFWILVALVTATMGNATLSHTYLVESTNTMGIYHQRRSWTTLHLLSLQWICIKLAQFIAANYPRSALRTRNGNTTALWICFNLYIWAK